MRAIIKVTILVTFFCLTFPIHAQFAEAINQRKQSTVKVRAKFGAEWLPGTGFLWRQPNQVVTALHVVAGSNEIQVYSEVVGRSYGARVKRVHLEADLALLELDGTFDLQPFQNWEDYKQDQGVVALGYRGGQKRMDDTKLRVRVLGKKLENIIPESAKTSLRENGFPGLNLEIVNLDGSLLPGHSGCPIIDQEGNLVSIGDGGLESGFVSASWGIPASMLVALEASSDRMPSVRRSKLNVLFAADVDFSTSEKSIRIAGKSLSVTRVRSLDDAFKSTDDPVGLQQLVSLYSGMIPGFDPSRLRFDIYQDSESGATLVFPQGSDPQPISENTILLKENGGNLTILVRLQDVGPARVQQTALEFENGQGCFLDTRTSYFAPLTRFDGMTAYRKSLICNFNQQYRFETLVTRQGWFLGAMATNNLFGQWSNNDPQHLLKWAKMVIAVHLTNFSI